MSEKPGESDAFCKSDFHLIQALADAFVDTTHHDTYGAITPEQWNLTGRIVLVTGSSRGIGRASAVSYARAGASGIIVTGRSVALLDEVEKEVIKSAEMRKKSDGNTAPGPAVKVLKLVLDVTDEASANDAARLVRETFGRLDILVNNAGYISSVTSVLETQSEDWNQTWATNVTGPFLVTRALLPLLIGSKDGLKTIVNVNSVAALLNTPSYMAYIVRSIARFEKHCNLTLFSPLPYLTLSAFKCTVIKACTSQNYRDHGNRVWPLRYIAHFISSRRSCHRYDKCST